MTLDSWQAQVERHFESLASLRAGSGLPLFALEHGLSDEALSEISALLQAQLRSGARLSRHWLLWVVYATERGYEYAGDEYWQSFEEQTPAWDFPDRYRIVPWFKKFQQTYDGVIPSGPWANHFRIIAWPITHAVLPRYLQRQFARALYDLRFHLAGLETIQPAAIGRLLATSCDHVTTRFEEFLQQEELTGRIVLALLGDAPGIGLEPIYPQTLQRIVSDLERVRNAREWLRETRRVVTDRFKGVSHTDRARANRRRSDGDHSQKKDSTSPSIRPSLLLRYSGSETWSVVMEVPSFRNVAALSSDVHTFLRTTRCRLSGADDMKPAGWLLSGTRKAVLKTWPDPKRPLIQFERRNGVLDHLVESECRLDSGPIWLFRLGVDGNARGVAARVVRPGHTYLVLTRTQPQEPHAHVSRCTVVCSGITAFRLTIPPVVSADDMKWLHGIGLKVSRTIRLWPAGFCARKWDGEGFSEWLTTENPCLGIIHDHPVDTYTLRLDGGCETQIKAKPAGQPTFVKLPRLPRGRHLLSARVNRAQLAGQSLAVAELEGVLTLDVRDPEPWVPGTTAHVGMSVLVDPYDATLDDFCGEEVNVTVLGPEGHRISCWVTLYRISGEPIFAEEMASFDLPVTKATWSRRLHEFLKEEARTWSYVEAASAQLTIRGEELGELSVRFERNGRPIRWACRRDHRNVILRLVDDTGRDEEPSARQFTFHRPAIAEAIDAAEFRKGITIDGAGGLFVAQSGDDCDAIIVSAYQESSGFQGLIVESDLTHLQTADTEPRTILHLLELWMDARLAGPLAGIRRDRVVLRLCQCLYTRMCGSRWGKAEIAFLGNTESAGLLDALVGLVDRRPSFGIVLHRDAGATESGTAERTNWFAALAAQFSVCHEPSLAEFALRLASQPHRLSRAYADQLDSLLRKIIDYPALLRGARLLALLDVAKRTGGAGSSLPRWTWRS